MAPVRFTKANKYRAKSTVVDGIRFHSQLEARRYGELKMLEKAGEIRELELQPKFVLKTLLTTGTVMGAAKALTHQYPVIGTAIMDFAYRDKFDDRIVEDVKGMDNALSRWKRKHVEMQYGVKVKLVTR
jgi:hypothetical protein